MLTSIEKLLLQGKRSALRQAVEPEESHKEALQGDIGSPEAGFGASHAIRILTFVALSETL